jgi:O-antigen ligase
MTGLATSVVDDPATPTPRALRLVRAAAVVTAIGAVTSPPLAVAGSVLMIVAFAFVPDALVRLARVLREPLGRGWLAFVAALLVAAAVGAVRSSPAVAALALLDWRQLLLVPVALAAFDSPASRARFALALVGLALAGAVASLVAVGLDYSRNEQFPGIVLRNPVTQALTLSIGALLAGVLSSTQVAWARRWRLLLALVALALMAQLVFLQTGRSGFVALVVSAAVAALLLLQGRARLLALIVLPLLAAAVYAASPNLQQRFGRAVTELRHAADLPEYTSMGIRVIIWQTSAEAISDRPLLGYGLGGFPAAYAERIRRKHAAGWKSLQTTDPHNQYLFLWAEAGAVGLLGLVALLAGAFRQRGEPPYGAAALALLAAWCVNSLFSSHFQTFNEGHLIALLLGALLARTPPPSAQPARPPASIA